MLGSSPPGETSDGQIGGAPEKMHRTALTDEARAKLFEDAVCLDQNSPEPVRVLRIVCCVRFVLVEWYGIGNLIGFLVNLHVQPKPLHLFRQAFVKHRHRLRLKRNCTNPAVAGLDSQLMTDEVEIDLEGPSIIGNRRSGKPSGCNVKRHVPRVINPRTLSQANLTDDLGPHM